MITAPFEYHAPRTLREAAALLREHEGTAKVLGGGQSLVPMMRLRLAQPEHLVDLGRIPDLAYVRRDGPNLAIGPMTTYHTLESSGLVRRTIPLLAEACSTIGDLQVRNRGTIGGSLAHADPAADLPAVVLALEGTVRVIGGRRRSIPARRFFVDTYTTALEETELIAEVVLPVPPKGTGSAYEKFANKASRFAIVAVAALVTVDRRGVCTRARIGVTGAGPTAFRATAAERYLVGGPVSKEKIAAAAARADRGVDFLEDQHASAEYRQALLHVVTENALVKAAQRAGANI